MIIIRWLLNIRYECDTKTKQKYKVQVDKIYDCKIAVRDTNIFRRDLFESRIVEIL